CGPGAETSTGKLRPPRGTRRGLPETSQHPGCWNQEGTPTPGRGRRPSGDRGCPRTTPRRRRGRPPRRVYAARPGPRATAGGARRTGRTPRGAACRRPKYARLPAEPPGQFESSHLTSGGVQGRRNTGPDLVGEHLEGFSVTVGFARSDSVGMVAELEYILNGPLESVESVGHGISSRHSLG